jgi:hypothetical protein
MKKPLRRVPWCRHYAPVAVHLMVGFVFVLDLLLLVSWQDLQQIPNVIGTALGYFMPMSGFWFAVIIFIEQHRTRFEPQWVRNLWYYHITVPALYAMVLLFLRNDDLLNSMADASTDKLPVAYALTALPLLFYLYRIFMPFSLITYLRKHPNE